jgi:transposase
MLSPEIKKRYILQILAGERSQSDVARATGFSRQAVSQWIKQYRSEGEGGIRKRRGRPKIGRLPEQAARRLKAIVTSQTPAEVGLDKAFSEWSYEAVRRLIIRETGVKLTYRFVAEYLEEWGIPHPMTGQLPSPARKHTAEPAKTVRTEKAPAKPRINEEETETFSLAEYETAIAEARKNLKPQERPPHGKRTGRHARQRSSPNQKKRKRNSRRKRR